MSTDPMIGRRLGGTYRIVERLGGGAIGVIYAASHTRLPRRYAVKVLAPGRAGSPEVVRRFRREAEIVAALSHPHIVELCDFAELESGELYAVMELLEGEDLAQRLARGPLPLPSLRRVFRDLCGAIEVAHRAGVVHRDLKPANVFLIARDGRDDFAKVLDFGISKLARAAGTQLTGDAQLLGTPSYMAPEQARGEARGVDGRGDVFALGAILFEALTGRVAFTGESVVEVLVRIGSGQVPRVAELAPELAPFDAVVGRALAHDRERRFASVAELGAAVEEVCAALTDAPPAARSTLSAAAAQRLAPAPRRRGMAALALLAAIAGGAVLALRRRPTTPAAVSPPPPPPPAPRREPTPALAALPALVPVAAASFAMGTDDPGASLERPRHPVTVAAFWLGATEVSNAEYALYASRHPEAELPEGWSGRRQPPDGLSQLPVVGLDWEQAGAYCRWAYPGGGRLPTEAEWELAARGAVGREFPWGDAFDPRAANLGGAALAPVGAHPGGGTPEGIQDLAGNAFEWTSSPLSRYDDQPLAPALRNRRVLRGGSFATRADGAGAARPLRAWYRDFATPATRNDVIGLRCAWSLP